MFLHLNIIAFHVLTSGKHKLTEVHTAFNGIKILRKKFASDQYVNLEKNYTPVSANPSTSHAYFKMSLNDARSALQKLNIVVIKQKDK